LQTRSWSTDMFKTISLPGHIIFTRPEGMHRTNAAGKIELYSFSFTCARLKHNIGNNRIFRTFAPCTSLKGFIMFEYCTIGKIFPLGNQPGKRQRRYVLGFYTTYTHTLNVDILYVRLSVFKIRCRDFYVDTDKLIENRNRKKCTLNWRSCTSYSPDNQRKENVNVINKSICID